MLFWKIFILISFNCLLVWGAEYCTKLVLRPETTTVIRNGQVVKEVGFLFPKKKNPKDFDYQVLQKFLIKIN